MQKKRPFPARQLAVLQALAREDNQSAADLGATMKCTREASRDCLERMRARGSVSRVPSGEGKTFYYKISKKGRKRLAYLELHKPRQAVEHP
jgi:predicted ArsR family transcriptional regulator